MDIKNKLDVVLKSKNITKIICSNPILKNGEVRINGRLFENKGDLFIQLETVHSDNKVTHNNVVFNDDLCETLVSYFKKYKQTVIYSNAGQLQILCNKKGNITVRDNIDYDILQKDDIIIEEHNRYKKKIIEDGVPVKFLVELGVMDEQGRVFKKKRSKFK